MSLDKKVNRKEFLKLTGLATLLGAGGPAAFSILAQSAGETKDTQKVRYGLVVDTRKCREGCHDCMIACHSRHNVPAEDVTHIKDKKEEVKWIWKEPVQHLFPNQDYSRNSFFSKASQKDGFLTLCNHCKNPPCVRVCPTQATWKRSDDGIVMMDYHRCIGCRFCMAACPYGSRSFNFKDPRKSLTQLNPEFPTRTRGVVEKCTLCEEIISDNTSADVKAGGGAAVKKIPLCVQSCKEGAITFGDLNDPDSAIRKILADWPALRRKAELGTEPSVFYLV